MPESSAYFPNLLYGQQPIRRSTTQDAIDTQSIRADAQALVSHGTSTGTNTSGSIVLPILSAKYPPCRVCDGKSSGVHYGVITCEACKAFYRRFLLRRTVSRCKHSGRCIISCNNAKHCQACRLQKCLAVGMSKDLVKIGRTNCLLIRAVEEVKHLELQLRMKHDGTLTTPEERNAQMDQICKKMTNLHLTHFPHSAQFYRTIHEQETIYLENQCLEEDLFGKRRIIPRAEYNAIYQQTRLDVDGRRAMLERLTPMMQYTTDSLIEFVRSIPGFKMLSKNDQRLLMKYGLVSSNCLFYHSLYNTDAGLFVYPSDPGIVVQIESMMGYIDNPAFVYEHVMMSMTHMQRLELTREETAVASALGLLLSDVELSATGQKIVNSSADSLAEALYRLLHENHDPEEQVYARFISILCNMRTYFQPLVTHLNNIVEDTPDVTKPSFFTDMYSGSVCQQLILSTLPH